MATINNLNVLSYIDKLLIDPYNVKIDLNTSKTTSDNKHRWITLADAIKGGYSFNFDYDIKEPLYNSLPEVVVTAKPRFYSTGAGEVKSFNNSKLASDYALAHPKDDPSENGLNYLIAGAFMNPTLATSFASGIAGDRLFHDAVQSYNGVDIDKNGMWVYNPGGWITGYGASKLPQAGKALYSFGRTNIGTKGSRLSYVMNQSAKNYAFELPELIPLRIQELYFNKPAAVGTYEGFQFEWPNLFAFERVPKRISFKERLGIPKGERNLRSNHPKMYDYFYSRTINSTPRIIPILDNSAHVYNIPKEHQFLKNLQKFWDEVINPRFLEYGIKDARYFLAVPITESNKKLGGVYFHDSRTPIVYTLNYYDDMFKTAIHEGPSHSSDTYVTSEIIGGYNNAIRKLNKLGKPNNRNSFNWEEFRATKNEILSELYDKGINIDNMTDALLLTMLKNTNAYGDDYVRLLNIKHPSDTKPLIDIDYGNGKIVKSSSGEKDFISDLRYAIKYLPSALAGIGTATTLSNK